VWVQVPLIEAVKVLVLRRALQKRWSSFKMRPDKQGYALFEEVLFWVAVLHRWAR
jgi:hypothetical protein